MAIRDRAYREHVAKGEGPARCHAHPNRLAIYYDGRRTKRFHCAQCLAQMRRDGLLTRDRTPDGGTLFDA